MAFNISTTKVASKRLIKVVETKTSGKIILNDERVVNKVLDGFGLVSVTNDEKLGENIQFNGAVQFTALFADGEKMLQSESCSIEFTEREQVGDAESIFISPEIKSYKLSKDSEKVISVIVTIESSIYAVTQEDLSAVSGEETGFYTETRKVVVDKLVASGVSQFTLSDELEINDKIDKILIASSTTEWNKVIPNDNYVTIEGSSTINVFYSVGDQLKKSTKVVDFNQEVSLLGSEKEVLVDALLNQKSLITSLDNLEEGSKQKVIVDLSIGVGLWGFKKTSVDLIEDVFSDTKELKVDANSFVNRELVGSKSIDERLNIVINTESKKRMDEIVRIGEVKTIVTKISRDVQGSIEISGVVQMPVIYKNYDSEDIHANMLESEFKFSTSSIDSQAPEIEENVALVTKCTSFKNKAGKEISLTLEVGGVLSESKANIEGFISKIEVVGEEAPREHSIIVLKPAIGQSVFEIARELKISPDVLRAQNPGLEDGKQAEVVVVYRKNS